VILEGMVKSLHPKILAGIQFDRAKPEDLKECEKYNIPVIDIVATNFAGYETIAGDLSSTASVQVAPITIIKAAAINYKSVTVVTEPLYYPEILNKTGKGKCPSVEFRKKLAAEAWQQVMHYDLVVTRAIENASEDLLPDMLRGEYRCVNRLKYGENPHQEAALYATPVLAGPTVAGARQVFGNPLSYNNVIDADNGLALALEFAAPGAVIIKHAMPVSAAIGVNCAEAMKKAFAAEWASHMGAAVASNNVIDAAAASVIINPNHSIDLVIASDFTPEAIEIFREAEKINKELRLLKVGDPKHPAGTYRKRKVALHHVSGGVLAQLVDDGVYGSGGFHVATKRIPSDFEMIDLEFACLVAKHARTHATVLAKDGATVAVATVQTARIEAAQIALNRAGGSVRGCVMASDGKVRLAEVALFAEAGVKAIIHTGCDNPDEEKILIQACDQHGIAMVVTRMRHFCHI
jgi:phosphoribosylaminoimidazolecarboxamide formyltransferase/IMP cyclohydrolase